jgi:hypothetical protein
MVMNAFPPVRFFPIRGQGNPNDKPFAENSSEISDN